MGWFGYGKYDSDDTQTQHITFCEWAELPEEADEICDNWLKRNKTKIPQEYLILFKKNISKVLSKMNNNKFWDEDKAIEWQMLACLFLDNNIKIPKIIKDNGILATEFLLGEHSSDFGEPGRRRAALRRLLKQIKKGKK